jgi:hypothetical protein
MATEELSRVQCVLKAQFDVDGSLTSDYQPLNGAGTQSDTNQIGFSDTAKILKIYNPSTTNAIDISLDGVNDHDFIPPSGTLIVDFQTNHYDGPIYGTGTLNVAEGQIIYGKAASNPTYLQIVGYR